MLWLPVVQLNEASFKTVPVCRLQQNQEKMRNRLRWVEVWFPNYCWNKRCTCHDAYAGPKMQRPTIEEVKHIAIIILTSNGKTKSSVASSYKFKIMPPRKTDRVRQVRYLGCYKNLHNYIFKKVLDITKDFYACTYTYPVVWQNINFVSLFNHVVRKI